MVPFPEFLFAESSHTAKHGYRQVHAAPANLKRFREVKRVTVDEPFGGSTQATHFGAGGVLDQLHGANRTPPMTRRIVRGIAWAQLAMGLLLLWSALGAAPIPAVLTLP